MTVLGKHEIIRYIQEGKLKIEPFEEPLVTENGIDLRIDKQYAVIKEDLENVLILLDKSNSSNLFQIFESEQYIPIRPGEFILATTVEYVELPEDLIALCELRSSLARWGLAIPPTVVDAGFKGQLTIEIFNNSKRTIHIPVYTPFLHLIFIKCEGAKPYQGFYQGQRGVKLPKNVKPVPPKGGKE